MLAAVGQDGNALQHTDLALHGDRETVLAAVKQKKTTGWDAHDMCGASHHRSRLIWVALREV